MPTPTGNAADGCYVLRNLRKLQKKWERKLPYLTQHGHGPWASSVLFAIETARHRIAEECPRSLVELNALLKEWEIITKEEEISTAPQSVKGLDFGMRLVVRRIRRCLLRSVQQDSSTSTNGGQALSDGKDSM
jgi:hypothetical protein